MIDVGLAERFASASYSAEEVARSQNRGVNVAKLRRNASYSEPICPPHFEVDSLQIQARSAKKARDIEDAVKEASAKYAETTFSRRYTAYSNDLRSQRELVYSEALENPHCKKRTQRYIVEHSERASTLEIAKINSLYKSIRRCAADAIFQLRFKQ